MVSVVVLVAMAVVPALYCLPSETRAVNTPRQP